MLYFAYGSNLNMKAMKKMCRDSKPITKAKLKNFKLTFNVYADIVESLGDEVFGALYEVSERDLIPLDEYEDYPELYKKEEVILEDEEGQTYKAFVYTMVEKSLKEPFEDYYEVIEQGYKDWNIETKALQIARSEFSKK